MDIDFMRIVDKWIGVPICASLSVLDMFSRLIRKRSPNIAPKNILFIELSEMGSSILAYPALRKIKETYPKANIYFLIFKKNRKSVDMLKLLDDRNVLTIRSGSFYELAIDTMKIIRLMRELKIDTVFDLELFSRYSSILGFLSGARTRVGFHQYHQEGLYRGSYLTHKVLYNPHQHMSHNFLCQVHALKSRRQVPLIKSDLKGSDLTLPHIEYDKERFWKKLTTLDPRILKESRLIVLNPNAGLLPIRAWPLSRYIQLTEKILEKHKDAHMIIIGVGEASADAKKIRSALKNDRVTDLTNKTALEDVIDLFNIARILITNDSGPAHFASLTPIKSIVFFGPETPKLYGPLGDNCIPIYSGFSCSPCVSAFNHRKTPCRNPLCLKAIDVETVFKEFEKAWKESPRK